MTVFGIGPRLLHVYLQRLQLGEVKRICLRVITLTVDVGTDEAPRTSCVASEVFEVVRGPVFAPRVGLQTRSAFSGQIRLSVN